MDFKNFLILSVIVVLSSCQKKTKTEIHEEKLELQYIAWACECANWAKTTDVSKNGNLNTDQCVFIEAENNNLKLPDTLGYSGDIVEFTGSFYPQKGYPKDYVKTEQDVEKAKVFKYSSFKIIRSNYKNFKE